MSNGSPVQRRQSASVPVTVIDRGATRSITPPARTCTRSHGSAGSPSGPRRATYSVIGTSGTAALPLGRTGATSVSKPARATAARMAASISPDSPPPRRSGRTQISSADTRFGVDPVSRPSVARWITRSQPPSGSSSSVQRSGTAYPRATARPGSAGSTAAKTNSGYVSCATP
ncbi:hypothetical protein ACFFKH_06140 [Micromonospora marina]|uniref:Uncharacterized protein n=1 Tax=Micromonospora marina TaxID=307120 RepID=A0A1C4W7Y4_9ACTN|nr:hypothetical protein [Micromonospora marina]SCE92308.1 hypothetical protein GA0070215_104293 [Micromonospora marina]